MYIENIVFAKFFGSGLHLARSMYIQARCKDEVCIYKQAICKDGSHCIKHLDKFETTLILILLIYILTKYYRKFFSNMKSNLVYHVGA